MKRKFLLGTIFAVMSLGFAACSNNNLPEITEIIDEETGLPVEETSEENKEVENKENSEGTETNVSGELFVSESYEAFMKGEETVFAAAPLVSEVDAFNGNIDELIEEEKYQIENYMYYDELSFAEAGYAYIDAGKDNVAELVISLRYTSDYDEYIQYLFIKDMGDKLNVIAQDHTYYRYESFITSNGTYYDGGSNSASAYGNRQYVITADGENICLYSDDVDLCVAQLEIPWTFLPESLWEEVGTDFSDEYEDNYCLFWYRIPNGQYDADGEELYDNYYYFEDSKTGESLLPGDEYIAWAKERNLNILSREEVEKVLDARREKFGVTKDDVNAEIVEFTKFK